MAPVVTADFVYVRRHGSPNRASSCYSQEELERDARSVRSWLEQGLDVYVFFNNDARGYAVENARTLKSLLGEQ
ncbi:MAG: DUF72 domain-containing protein, partial [Clostridia bacterium]|nr:DUF72 domain-containing protein [Clostridia bacterium]